jgi:DUF971 family protein
MRIWPPWLRVVGDRRNLVAVWPEHDVATIGLNRHRVSCGDVTHGLD